MASTAHHNAFLLLEGVTDSRFWSMRKHPSCEVVISDGKRNLIGAIERLDHKRFSRAAGLIDDDADRSLGSAHPSPNLIRTDTADLETFLLRSGALPRVLAEQADPVKLRAFEARGTSVRDHLLHLGLPLARIRRLARQRELRGEPAIEMDRYHPSKFIDRDTWTLDESRILDEAEQQGGWPPRAQLQAELAALVIGDPWMVCRGHDLVKILGIGLARVLGDANPGEERLGTYLRLALQDQELERSTMYAELRAWEHARPPLRLLA